ncbi:MAG: DUF6702 family protein [Sediminibacterium sp.]
MNRILKVLIWPLLLMTTAFVHPFYVSLIDISYNEAEATAEISIRIFTDDLEQTLRKQSGTKIDLVNPKNKAAAETELSKYIRQKILLNIDGKPCQLEYLGYEIQKESVWSYWEVKQVKSMKGLQIDCSLLYDFVNLQTNIFHVKKGEKEWSRKLDYPETKLAFIF